MSAVTAGLSSDVLPDRIRRNSITQWRHNNSGEIDVFEAARYFSGGGDIYNPNDVPPQRVLACRISLEMPPNNNPYNNLATNVDHDQTKQLAEKKKYKQPSSPGGKLASFLNSLFNQTTTSKKFTKTKKNLLSKSGSSKNDLEEVERKRRSSISHFRITTTTTNYSNDSKSTCGDTNITPTKPPLRSLSHHQIEMGVSAPSRSTYGGVDQKRITNGNNINYKNHGSSFGFSDRSSTMNHYYWGDEDRQRECTRKFGEDDDEDDGGADSDSSSDLFDLDFCSSGNLPVYGTTHMGRIKISAPISAIATPL